jgi:hypothetical protein
MTEEDLSYIAAWNPICDSLFFILEMQMPMRMLAGCSFLELGNYQITNPQPCQEVKTSNTCGYTILFRIVFHSQYPNSLFSFGYLLGFIVGRAIACHHCPPKLRSPIAVTVL